MRGGCRCFPFLNIFFASVLFACGDNRETGVRAGSADTGSPAVGAVPDTATAAAADTGTSAPLKPAEDVARATPPSRTPATPAPKPTAPAPKPAAPAPDTAAPAVDTAAAEPEPPAALPADTPPATPPAQASDTASGQTQASAPLRDEYHRAPLDTVVQEVYDGWKQYNLNCARCHGEDVLGTTIAPHLILSLKPNGPINTKELFVQTVCVGRPEKGMPAWCPLGMEMEKIQAIYSYVKGRSDGKLRPGRPALRGG